MFPSPRTLALTVCFLMLVSDCFAFVSSAHFKAGVLCDTQAKIDLGCLTNARSPVNAIECGMLCAGEESCEGVLVGQGSECLLLQHCPGPTSTCLEVHNGLNYYKRWPNLGDCLNGGSWNAGKGTCRCYNGFVGLRCERYAESCAELFEYDYGYQFNRKTFLKPPGFTAPFQTNCAILKTSGIRTDIFHQTNVRAINNTRAWSEYVDGYYAAEDCRNESDFWLGLEKIHHFNQRGNLKQLNIMLEFKSPYDLAQLQYDDVVIGGPEANYSLSYQKFKRIDNYRTWGLTDCFSSNTSTAFSTPDADHDQDASTNCAEEAGAGWWFGTCNPSNECNPLGEPYITGMETATSRHIRFKGEDIRNYAKNLTAIRMFLFQPFK